MLYNVGLVSATQHRESVMTIKYHFNENFGNATRSVWASTGYKGNKLEKALGWNSGDRIDLGSTTHELGVFAQYLYLSWSQLLGASATSERKVLVSQSCLTLCDPMDYSQAPLSMEFSRQEYWSGLPFPSPGDLLDPGIEPESPALQIDSLPSERVEG